MIVNKENFYIVKEHDGTVWSFIYDKNMGLKYKILKERQWSNYSLFIKECSGKFDISSLPNNNIYIFYENFYGSILLKIYDKTKWRDEKIIQHLDDDILETNFKTISIKNEIHIVYSILNKKIIK